MLTAERRTTPEQRTYIQEHLGKLKGMMAELVAKKTLLQDRLNKSPENIGKPAFLQREIANVEERMNVLMVSVEFIELWPESCVGLCDKNLPPCTHQEDCPYWIADNRKNI